MLKRTVLVLALCALVVAPALAQQPADTFDGTFPGTAPEATNHPTLEQILGDPQMHLVGSSIAVDGLRVEGIARINSQEEIPRYRLDLREPATGARVSFAGPVLFVVVDDSIARFIRDHRQYDDMRAAVVFAPSPPKEPGDYWTARVISVTWTDSKGSSVTAR